MKPLATEQKLDRTDAAARQIMNAELAAREKKTARLRALRQEKEAAERAEAAKNPPPVKRARKKAS
ncbi:hypothetical protein [Mesorhizobium sp. KR1-2]|uniref:hypothetical protein n=1 Tax=Mesorhizobium sp. KR1-2 TaxID=3156609 RepID=UPI0032B418C9